MAIPEKQIKELIDAVKALQTPEPLMDVPEQTPISDMYARWTLDCVVNVAHAVGQDFVKRIRHYRDVPGPIATHLSDFKARSGHDPMWPNAEQRANIFEPLFGASAGYSRDDPTSAFHESAKDVRHAAVAFSERVFDTGEAMLRRAFVDAAEGFLGYLSTLAGSVVQVGDNQTRTVFGRAREILTDQAVAQAFGLPQVPTSRAPGVTWPPGAVWPLTNHLDGDGAYLIQEIARNLDIQRVMTINQQRFRALQRVAHQGALTIAAVNNGGHRNAPPLVDRLIEFAYSWATALRLPTTESVLALGTGEVEPTIDTGVANASEERPRLGILGAPARK